MLEAEHRQTAALMADIHSLLVNFKKPLPGNLQRLAVAIEEFSREVHLHLHIENNVLFPKLIRLEEELQTGTGNDKN